MKNSFINFTDEDAYLLIGLNCKREKLRRGGLENMNSKIQESYKTVNWKIPTAFLEKEIRKISEADSRFKISFTLIVISTL